MGALFLVHSNIEQAEEYFSLGNESMRRQGFSQPRILKTREYQLAIFNKQVAHSENIVFFGKSKFCACVGTFLYRESTGKSALTRYYQDFLSGTISVNSLYGSYCIIIHYDDQLSMCLDPLEIYKIYGTADNKIISSSFLAALSCNATKTINIQGLYEYIFQGATYGTDTVIREIDLLGNEQIHATATLKLLPTVTEPLLCDSQSATFESNIENCHAKLKSEFKAIAKSFGAKIDTALSGGYDSRLTLALLNEQDLTPRIHVYGKVNDSDVVVAKCISDAEKIDLTHIDKSSLPKLHANEYCEIVSNNLLSFDGIPTDGIFNSGTDITSRIERCKNGEVMLNGGGGEIFRNFYYVLNKSMSIQSFLWTFYSQFDPRVTTLAFCEYDYHAKLTEKIKRCLQKTNNKLAREEVDLLYPLFRCRYWMGKNNAVNNRLGLALTPFIDIEIVRAAANINPRYKDHGIFEAALIQKINPKLAAYPSAYGYDFSERPPLKYRIKDYLTYIRPAWLRRYAFRIRTRRAQFQRPWTLANEYLRHIFPHQFQYLQDYIDANELKDNAQFNRACTLEYLFQTYKPVSPESE